MLCRLRCPQERSYPIYFIQQFTQVEPIAVTFNNFFLKAFELNEQQCCLELCHPVVASQVKVFIPGAAGLTADIMQ
ncbi:MAG: hypothetical protein BWY89_01931 [Bacteroidetes bacterium ADurb.BinA012]|nr:MAG: hypothetical protein BWY89_01931 [Bacteroidetes bacterium ADurb.BinA012]